MSVWDAPTPRQLERREYLAPLFAYLRAHGIASTWVARRMAVRRGYRLYPSKLIAIRAGECRIPPHFVADCCHELERDPVSVMGADWVAAHPEVLLEYARVQPAEDAACEQDGQEAQESHEPVAV